jgi:hypothetical protein
VTSDEKSHRHAPRDFGRSRGLEIYRLSNEAAAATEQGSDSRSGADTVDL